VVASWPVSCSARALRGFLGLASYYRSSSGTSTSSWRQSRVSCGETHSPGMTRLKRPFRRSRAHSPWARSYRCRTSTRSSQWTTMPRARGLVPSSTGAPNPLHSSTDPTPCATSSSPCMSGSSLGWSKRCAIGGRTCGSAPLPCSYGPLQPQVPAGSTLVNRALAPVGQHTLRIQLRREVPLGLPENRRRRALSPRL